MGILSGIAALGSAIFGAVSSSEQNRAAAKLIKQQRKDNQHWYNIRMAEDYTNRADVQRAVEKQRQMLDEQYQKARGQNVVAGATDESVALQKEAANKSVADATASVAAAAAEDKNRVEAEYRRQDAALNQQEVGIKQQQAANTAAAAGQAVSAALNVMGNDIASSETPDAKKAPTTPKLEDKSPAPKVTTPTIPTPAAVTPTPGPVPPSQRPKKLNV